MSNEQMIQKTADYVKNLVMSEPGHDWSHIERVWKNSKSIARNEKCNMFVVELGALLHDIADWKFHGDEAGPKKAREWLQRNNVDQETTDAVVHIVENISFKSGRPNKITSLEGKIVQDADRLDAIGAIGVARAFSYGGFKNRPMHGPGETTINHFHEKILLLYKQMNTKTGKKMAKERHAFTKKYLGQFFKEWDGKK